jgi:hypothetical protein
MPRYPSPSEVVQAILKEDPESLSLDPQTVHRLGQALEAERSRAVLAEADGAALRCRVIFLDAVLTDRGVVPINQVYTSEEEAQTDRVLDLAGGPTLASMVLQAAEAVAEKWYKGVTPAGLAVETMALARAVRTWREGDDDQGQPAERVH